MAPTTAMGSQMLQRSVRTACSCTSRPIRAQAVRHQSTSSQKPKRIVAAALVSRPPLVLPPLTPLERTYYAYQRRIHRALAKPLSASTEWFFKKGSTAEASFVAYDARTAKETGAEEDDEAYAAAREGVEVRDALVERETEADKKKDVRSLERKLDRTLYLLLKKDRKENAWQFPQGGVESGESLLEAAQRELVEETGPNMDVWSVGRVPAAAYSYPFPAAHLKQHPEHSGASVFFLPMRVIRGQAKPNKAEGLVDFAWLSKEEIKEKVSPNYWKAVEPVLSEQ